MDEVLTNKTGTHPGWPRPTGQDMRQVAPYPHALVDLLRRLHYRAGWVINLQDLDRGQGSEGLTLVVTALVPDSRNGNLMRVNHFFPVPPAAYNERSWRHWLFERLLEVEHHEAAEFFVIDGERPFAPLHAPGNDPYMRVEATYTEAHTNFKGEAPPDSDAEIDEAMSKALGYTVYKVNEPKTVPTTWEPMADPLKGRPKGWGE